MKISDANATYAEPLRNLDGCFCVVSAGGWQIAHDKIGVKSQKSPGSLRVAFGDEGGKSLKFCRVGVAGDKER